MIFNFLKKNKRGKHKKLIDEIDAAYIAKGGKKISDETIRKAKVKKYYKIFIGMVLFKLNSLQ
jgi:hypothetical protein